MLILSSKHTSVGLFLRLNNRSLRFNHALWHSGKGIKEYGGLVVEHTRT